VVPGGLRPPGTTTHTQSMLGTAGAEMV